MVVFNRKAGFSAVLANIADIAPKRANFKRGLAEVPQLSQHVLAFKRLGGRFQAIFSTTFSMIFDEVNAKPRCAISSATAKLWETESGK